MINDLMSLESMLFKLKEVTKDTDALGVKKEIDLHIAKLTESGSPVVAQKEIAFIKETVSTVSKSFKNRQRQMLTDTEIVNKINIKIDDFRREHQIKIEGLLSSLMRDIDEAIDKYATEIVRRLDPLVIKERFKKKEDFELWLTTLNISYKEAMEKTVDRKTQGTIRSYLVDVEDVFEVAKSYLINREVIIPVEDVFYGSLSASKNAISRDIRNNINELTVYNKSLYEASEDLFNGIWEARKKYDQKRFATTTIATVVGAGGLAAGTTAATAAAIGASTVSGLVASGAVASSTATALGASGLISVGIGALPIIAGIAVLAVGGIVIAKTASKLSSALYSGNLEKDVRCCIDEFTGEINKSKFAMQSHITENIKLIFENELKSLDRTFFEFRKATYIDEDKIPKLTTKLDEIKSGVMEI